MSTGSTFTVTAEDVMFSAGFAFDEVPVSTMCTVMLCAPNGRVPFGTVHTFVVHGSTVAPSFHVYVYTPVPPFEVVDVRTTF